ncbi:hypothetical protein BD779DRAFT_1786606 [Infundibulicybe gibba]|nr:hypothetical protein BD779DRAFT_1786606 [Infundibulicybe gibba]
MAVQELADDTAGVGDLEEHTRSEISAIMMRDAWLLLILRSGSVHCASPYGHAERAGCCWLGGSQGVWAVFRRIVNVAEWELRRSRRSSAPQVRQCWRPGEPFDVVDLPYQGGEKYEVSPNTARNAQSRALSALANLLVRNHEVVAVVGNPKAEEFSTHNPPTKLKLDIKPDCPHAPQRIIITQNPRDEVQPNTTNSLSTQTHCDIPSPEDLQGPECMEKILTYLMKFRTVTGSDIQDFRSHATLIMQFASDASSHLREGFIAYVVGSSAPKMLRRINHHIHSKPYFDAVIRLPANDIKWIGENLKTSEYSNEPDSLLIETLHGEDGVRFLKEVQAYIVQKPAPKDPHVRRLISELENSMGPGPVPRTPFPKLWHLSTTSALYTKETFREFHTLLSIALVGYRNGLKLVQESNPTKEKLEKAINSVSAYLMVLSRIAYSAAAINHFAVIANNGRKPSAIGVRVPPPSSCEIRWLRLQVTYIKSIDHIRDLYQQGTLPGPISLDFHTIPPPSPCKAMAPLVPVVEDIMEHYKLELDKQTPMLMNIWT